MIPLHVVLGRILVSIDAVYAVPDGGDLVAQIVRHFLPAVELLVEQEAGVVPGREVVLKLLREILQGVDRGFAVDIISYIFIAPGLLFAGLHRQPVDGGGGEGRPHQRQAQAGRNQPRPQGIEPPPLHRGLFLLFHQVFHHTLLCSAGKTQAVQRVPVTPLISLHLVHTRFPLT